MKFLDKIENEELRAEIKTAIEQEIKDAKDLVANDASKVKEYKLQGFKEAERKIQRDLKKAFNLDSTDLDEAKDYKEWFNVALDKVKEEGKHTGQEWQDKYMALKDDFNVMKDETLPNALESAKSEIKKYKIDNILGSKISALENLAIDKNDFLVLAKAKLNQLGVKLDLDGDSVTALTEEGTKPTIDDKALDFEGLVNHFSSPYIKNNGASDTPTTPTRVVNTDGMTSAKAATIKKFQDLGVPIPEALR